MRPFLNILQAATLTLALLIPAIPAWANDGVNDAAIMAKKPPRRLSTFNIFKNPQAQIPNDRVVPYNLNNPLFTDYAEKYRFIYIPEGAGAAPYNPDDILAWPVGSMLVKTFAYPADFRTPNKNIRLIETRLLLHKETGWVAYPYVWDEAMTDAKLKLAGKRLTMPVTWQDGSSSDVDYAVPNFNQCKGCHINKDKAFTPIGPKVRNMNDPHDYGDGIIANQVNHLQQIGYIAGAPANPADMPRIPRSFDNTDGSLFERARGYLDGNCAHCHSPGRPADTSGLYLDYTETRPVHWGIMKPPVAAGRGAGGLKVDIHPGQADKSILAFRMNSVDPGIMMPELGRGLIHKEGLALITEFINALDESDY